jgi:hypothetical protein
MTNETIDTGVVAKINTDIQRAVGLGDYRLRSLNILLRPDKLPIVEAVIVMDAGHQASLCESLARYELRLNQEDRIDA